MSHCRYAILLSCGLFFGCLLELSDKSEVNALVVGCQRAAECPENSRCTLGACIVGTQADDLYRIRLLPSEGSGFEILDIVDVRLDVSGIQDLNTIRVPAPIKTSGSVRTEDGNNIQADVIAISDSGNGDRIRVDATTALQGIVSTFQMTLPTVSQTMVGTTRPLFFDLTILPEAEQGVPPFTIRAVQSAGLTPPYFIDLPSTNELVRVQGRVLFDSIDRLPVNGMNAILTGSDSRRLSTIGKSDSEGRFELQVWSEDLAEVTSLILQSSTVNLPRIEAPITLNADQDLQIIEEQKLNLGGQFIDWEGSIIGSEGLASTSIAAVAQLSSGRVSASVSASDSEGAFQMRLIPARYLVQIIPPIDSPFGMLRTLLDVKLGEPVTLRPALKTSFTGQLSDTDARPISNAAIKATLTTPDFGDAALTDPLLKFGERITQTNTDAEGLFDLRLEPGTYTFTITPPVSSGLAPFKREVTCPRTTGTPVVFNFEAPLSHVLTLRLVDNGDLPIEGELVQIWHQGSAEHVTSARSNENGYVLLRLPARMSEP